jgi:hypothetical protein
MVENAIALICQRFLMEVAIAMDEKTKHLLEEYDTIIQGKSD